MAKAKEITIIQYRSRMFGETRRKEITGTIEYLVNDYFGYTLDCGRSWQHEKGNKKIPENANIRSAKVLVNALNNAENNRAANGCSNTWYELKLQEV